MSACGGSFACLARRSAFLGGLLGLSGLGGGEKVVGWFGGKGSIADIGKSEPFSPLLPPRSGVQYVYVCTYSSHTARKVRTYFVVQEDPDYSRTEATHWISSSTTGWSIHSKLSRVLVAVVGRKNCGQESWLNTYTVRTLINCAYPTIKGYITSDL